MHIIYRKCNPYKVVEVEWNVALTISLIYMSIVSKESFKREPFGKIDLLLFVDNNLANLSRLSKMLIWTVISTFIKQVSY